MYDNVIVYYNVILFMIFTMTLSQASTPRPPEFLKRERETEGTKQENNIKIFHPQSDSDLDSIPAQQHVTCVSVCMTPTVLLLRRSLQAGVARGTRLDYPLGIKSASTLIVLGIVAYYSRRDPL